MAIGTAAAQTEDAYVDELAPGQTLLRGQYRIERYLNSGGFGITYLARDSLDRLVVIKECFPGALCHRAEAKVRPRSRALHGEFRSMVSLFLREARNLSKLRHSNIVGVHQVFEDNDTAYMALDLVEGRDLLEMIEDRAEALTPAVIQAIMLRLLDAVSFMHKQDILHRDISPDNILLNTGGEPVLIDFGSAREEATKASRVLTAMLMVKDGYSPQEFYIANSKQLPCSDLYALGATFYHLVTRAAPPNSQARLAAIATGDPDPYQPVAGRFPGFDPAFLAAIDKAMNVFPGDRIQTAEEWIRLIDPNRRREDAVAEIARDQDIALTITRLITQANAMPPLEPAPTPRQRTVPPPEVPKPRVIEYIGFDNDDDVDDSGHAEDLPKPIRNVSAQRRVNRIDPRGERRITYPRKLVRVVVASVLIGLGLTVLSPLGHAAVQTLAL